MIYLDLFLSFLKVGPFSFGGAYGAIPIIRDMVLAHGWLTDEKLTYMIAVSESTPEPIMVNLATYVGNTQGGFLGAFLATLGVVLPSFCIRLLITAIKKNVIKNKYFQAVLGGLKPCVIGIILATGLHLILTNCLYFGETISLDIKALIILLVLILIMLAYKLIAKKKLSPIMLIVVSAFVGIAVCGFF